MVNCIQSTTYSCCDWQATLQSRKVGKQKPGLTSAVFELSWDLRSSTWSWSSLTSAITALPDTGVLGLIGQCWCRAVAGLLNPFPQPLVSLTHRHKWGGDRSGLGSNLPCWKSLAVSWGLACLIPPPVLFFLSVRLQQTTRSLVCLSAERVSAEGVRCTL